MDRVNVTLNVVGYWKYSDDNEKMRKKNYEKNTDVFYEHHHYTFHYN